MDQLAIYLEIDDAAFKNLSKDGLERSKKLDNDGDGLILDFHDSKLMNVDTNDDADEIHISGDLNYGGKPYGYLSFSIPIDAEIAAKVIAWSTKRLNKMKNVLESIE